MRIQKSWRPPGVEAPLFVEIAEGDAAGVPAMFKGRQDATLLIVDAAVEQSFGAGEASGASSAATAVAAAVAGKGKARSSKRAAEARASSTEPKVTESARLSVRLQRGSFSADCGLQEGLRAREASTACC